MYKQEYIHSTIDGHLGCLGHFLFKTIVHNAAMSILLVHMSTHFL